MVVSFGMVMKEAHINFLLTNPAARDKWILEVSVGHGIVIYTKNLIEINLIFLDLLFRPGCLPEVTQSKDSIIEVNNGVLIALCILLNFLDLDVLVRLTANFFFKS